MTLNLAGWHLQGKKCVWKKSYWLFFKWFWEVYCKQKIQLISDITNHCFFLPVCVDTRKINLVAGVRVQDSIIVMTWNLTGWHLQIRRCVWNRIACNENWKPISKNYTNKCIPNPLFLRQQSFSFFPVRVATHKIHLEVRVLVQDPMIVTTLNQTGWHLQVRRCVWKKILMTVRNENWKPSDTSGTRQQSFSFFPARVTTRKLISGWVC